ncbi:hypothetical protein M2454_001450 [Aequitasia blattaphilus]
MSGEDKKGLYKIAITLIVLMVILIICNFFQ